MNPFIFQILLAISCSLAEASNEYNQSGLLRKYRQHIDNKISRPLFFSFELYVKSYYRKNPLECLKWVCTQGWAFRLTFFAAMLSPHCDSDENNSQSYERMLLDTGVMIIKDLSKNYPTKEEKEGYFEVLKLLIKISQEAISRINQSKIPHYLAQISILKFLHLNLSYDYDRKTVDYYSFLHCFRNIIRLLRESKDLKNPSQELINYCIQFIIYSSIISTENCPIIFEYEHVDHLPCAIFYIKKYIRDSFYFLERLTLDPIQCAKVLIWIFEMDVKAKIVVFMRESLDFLPELLQRYKLHPRINSFTLLSNYLDFEFIKRDNIYLFWNLKAYIILEQYLVHNLPHRNILPPQ